MTSADCPSPANRPATDLDASTRPPPETRNPTASTRMLRAVCWGTLTFGATLVVMPGLAREGFSLLMFSRSDVIDGWPQQVRAYVTLVHGVLGAVMVGWATALLLVLRPQGRTGTGDEAARRVVGGSVLAWFVPDTVFSLAVGAWQNALLNAAFAVLFGLGLWWAGRAHP